jgi:hypothetical protein
MAKRISTFQTSGFRLYCVVGLLFFWGTTWAEVPEKITREATSDALKHDSTTCYFYQPFAFGSQGKYNPGDFFINGGYGVWQFHPDRQILKFPYEPAFDHIWESMIHPMYAIQQFGVKEWLTSEIIPTSLELKHGQFFPNYFLHAIGAGMQSRKMEEWYRYHEVPFPRLMSIVTMFSEHYFEEVIEDGGYRGLNEDPVTDMYIFNPLGILLFLNDDVCKFFSKNLNLNEWSLQPSFNFKNGNLENMGQFYVAKLPLEHTHTWSVMAYFGMQELLGITRTFQNEKSLSLTGGVIVNSLGAADISKSQKAYTANLRWSAGVFYDVKNSLLMSLVATGAEHNRLRLNIYPGLLKIGSFTPGIYVDNTGVWSIGMSIRYCPIGAAVGTE